MAQLVKIQEIKHLTHDVLGVKFEKPSGYKYELGQAADISFNEPEWKDTLSCFTFTSLENDDHLEFVIKTYPSHNRVTNKLLSAKVGDELFLYDSFGDIRYKGEGVFIAGGAGITPFLAILKDLESKGQVGNNKLIFANKTQEDIILKDYFDGLLGENFINVLSDEKVDGYKNGYVTEEIIKEAAGNNLKYFYLCGPKPMMAAVEKQLADLGVKEEFIVKEGF